MKKTQKIVIGVSVVVASFAMAAVTASLRTQNTPLYIYRMEQASSKMNFLPTEMNSFTYKTEKGYTLDYNIPKGYGGNAEPVGGCTLHATTCVNTCPDTCPWTCQETCNGWTCDDTSCQPGCPGHSFT
ncbi:MAG: hypothetical protein HXS48_12445 [Theionarchaea archaeon]|nr:hypothetical protein [Theionarchaea archaeon]